MISRLRNTSTVSPDLTGQFDTNKYRTLAPSSPVPCLKVDRELLGMSV
jgi:hypothetical protein